MSAMASQITGVSNQISMGDHWGRVTHMRKRNLSLLVQIMACCFLGAKPLPEPMLYIVFQLYPPGTNFSLTVIKIQTFSFKNMYMKMSSANCHTFCLDLNVLMSKGLMERIHAFAYIKCRVTGTQRITILGVRTEFGVGWWHNADIDHADINRILLLIT